MRQLVVIQITAGSWPEGPLLVDQLAVIKGFTAVSTYDPVVNRLLVFAIALYARPAVKHLAPSALPSMHDA
jgi:hypothetical protein